MTVDGITPVGSRPAAGAQASPAPRGTPGAGRSGAGSRFRTVLQAMENLPAGAAEAPWEMPRDFQALQGQAGLRWAAEQLESWLWSHLLQEALKPGEGGLFGSGLSGQVYGEWFCHTLATLLVDRGPGRLAGLLVEEFSGALTGEQGPERNSGGAGGEGGQA